MMHIIDPDTKVKYSLFSYNGKNLLKNYVKLFKIGGSEKTKSSKNTTKSSSRTATTEEINQDPLDKLVNRLMNEYTGEVHEKYETSGYKEREFNQLRNFLKKKKKFQDYDKISKNPLISGSIFNIIYYWRYRIFLK